VVVAVLLVMVGPAGPTTTNSAAMSFNFVKILKVLACPFDILQA
jgi:hypothetical protein